MKHKAYKLLGLLSGVYIFSYGSVTATPPGDEYLEARRQWSQESQDAYNVFADTVQRISTYYNDKNGSSDRDVLNALATAKEAWIQLCLNPLITKYQTPPQHYGSGVDRHPFRNVSYHDYGFGSGTFSLAHPVSTYVNGKVENRYSGYVQLSFFKKLTSLTDNELPNPGFSSTPKHQEVVCVIGDSVEEVQNLRWKCNAFSDAFRLPTYFQEDDLGYRKNKNTLIANIYEKSFIGIPSFPNFEELESKETYLQGWLDYYPLQQDHSDFIESEKQKIKISAQLSGVKKAKQALRQRQEFLKDLTYLHNRAYDLFMTLEEERFKVRSIQRPHLAAIFNLEPYDAKKHQSY